MKTERKRVTASIKATGDDGSFEAVIATFGVVDHDGDIIERGAFSGHPVSVLPSHIQDHVPLGKATFIERGDEAIAVGKFNLDIEAARDWHSALKFDLAEIQPSVQEWSWGFRVLGPDGARPDTVDGNPVRRLLQLDEREVSPVLRGASIGTGTLSAKRLKAAGVSDNDRREALRVALVDAEPDAEHIWVEAVFEDVVVYNLRLEEGPSKNFERGYTVAGDNDVALADAAPVQVIPSMSYVAVEKGDDAEGLKLVDHLRLTTFDVESAIARVLDAIDARKKRGRHLGGESKAEAVTMAERVRDMDRLMKQLAGMAEEILPDDQAGRAAARFLASEALRVGVDV